MDSIRENEKLEDMVTTLKMELDNDIEHNLNIVLVEGKDDNKFIRRIFSNRVTCYESFSGKRGLQELIQHDRIKDSRIIAIRDKDYSNPADYPERMWCYDTCCLETMLLKNENVREGLFATYYKGNVSQDLFFENILEQLAPISVLRQKNEEDDLQINFQKMKMGDNFDRQSEELNLLKIFQNIVLSILLSEFLDKIENEIIYCVTDMDEYDLARIFGQLIDYAYLDDIGEVGLESLEEQREEGSNEVEISGIMRTEIFLDGYVHWDGKEEFVDTADAFLRFKFCFREEDRKFHDFEMHRIV